MFIEFYTDSLTTRQNDLAWNDLTMDRGDRHFQREKHFNRKNNMPASLYTFDSHYLFHFYFYFLFLHRPKDLIITSSAFYCLFTTENEFTINWLCIILTRH